MPLERQLWLYQGRARLTRGRNWLPWLCQWGDERGYRFIWPGGQPIPLSSCSWATPSLVHSTWVLLQVCRHGNWAVDAQFSFVSQSSNTGGFGRHKNERTIFILKQICSILRQIDGMKSHWIRSTFWHIWSKIILSKGNACFPRGRPNLLLD